MHIVRSGRTDARERMTNILVAAVASESEVAYEEVSRKL